MGATLHCERSHEWISAELDGQLSELESVLLRRHLDRCPDCRIFAAEARAATALLRSQFLEHPDRRLGLPVRSRHARLRALPRAAAVAAAAMAAVTVVTLASTARRGPSTGNQGTPTVSDVEIMRQIRRQELRPHASPANPRLRVTVVG